VIIIIKEIYGHDKISYSDEIMIVAIIGGITSFTRIHSGVHFPSDCIVGIL